MQRVMGSLQWYEMVLQWPQWHGKGTGWWQGLLHPLSDWVTGLEVRSCTSWAVWSCRDPKPWEKNMKTILKWGRAIFVQFAQSLHMRCVIFVAWPWGMGSWSPSTQEKSQFWGSASTTIIIPDSPDAYLCLDPSYLSTKGDFLWRGKVKTSWCCQMRLGSFGKLGGRRPPGTASFRASLLPPAPGPLPTQASPGQWRCHSASSMAARCRSSKIPGVCKREEKKTEQNKLHTQAKYLRNWTTDVCAFRWSQITGNTL